MREKCLWEALASWRVDNHYRVMLRSRERGSHLVDVALSAEIYCTVMEQVMASEWTKKELIQFLNQRIKPQQYLSPPA